MKPAIFRAAALIAFLGGTPAFTLPAKAATLPLLPAFDASASASAVASYNGVVQAQDSKGPTGAAAIGTTSAAATGTAGASDAQVTIGTAPIPFVQATAEASNAVTVPTPSLVNATAIADLLYTLQVVGPSGTGAVPVTVTANGSFSGSVAPGNFGGDGGITLQVSLNSTSNLIFDHAGYSAARLVTGQSIIFSHAGAGTVSGDVSGVSGSIAENGTYMFLPNVPYTVEIIADATADIFGGPAPACTSCVGGNERTTAFLDPSFTSLDPRFTLDFSPGIGNSPLSESETPLPATLPLFAGGATIFGLLARRRKAVAVSAV